MNSSQLFPQIKILASFRGPFQNFQRAPHIYETIPAPEKMKMMMAVILTFFKVLDFMNEALQNLQNYNFYSRIASSNILQSSFSVFKLTMDVNNLRLNSCS